MNYKRVYFLLILFGIISISLGGTFAYWKWTSSESLRTEVVFTIEEDFRCSADGGGNITSNDVTLAPADCTNSKFAIQREIKVTPTIFGNNSIHMNLWLDINDLGGGLSNSNNFKYALTTEANSCTSGVVKTGNFNGKTQGDKVPLFNYMGYTTSTEETYYLYVWLDEEETSTSTMNQSFDLSINGLCTSAPEPQTYVVFNETDTTLRLYKRDENTSQISNTINDYNISKLDNNIQTIEEETISEEDKIYFDLENTVYSSAEQLPWYSYRESITRVIFEDDIKPKSMSNWFSGMTNVEYMDVSNVNTSKITSMSHLFYNVGSNITNSFEIVGLDNWNLSSVTSIYNMFVDAGKKATSWSIGDLSNWNVSSVTSMYGVFYGAGSNATIWDIGDLSEWDVSSVKNMSMMFRDAGRNATTWNIGDLSNWNVSKVTNMSMMFFYAALNATTFELNLTNWDVKNVQNMSAMFYDAGINATTWDIGDLSKWDVSNVTSMETMFAHAGENATTWNIGDLSEWDVSSVTNMSWMFRYAGRNATTWDIGDLSEWDVSNVTNMSWMFNGCGRYAITWNIGDISEWDVSKVTNMSRLFLGAGGNATYSLDLSGWNVSNVTSYDSFGDSNKIIPPVWNTSS